MLSTADLTANKIPKISLEEIKKGTRDFSESIGFGGFAEVYKGQLLINNILTAVAVKRLFKSDQDEHFLNEISLLSRCKHENIISLIGYCDEDQQLILVYEYAFYGSLDSYLEDTGKHKEFLTWVRRLKICKGAANGLLYLHNIGTQQRIIHRDIKSGNILIDQNLEAKIADFGLSRVGSANQSASILVARAAGTLGYLDPEYIKTGFLTKEVDVYAFGVVMFELLCGRLAMLEQHEDERRSLAVLVKKSSHPQKLSMIVDPNIAQDILPESMKIFLDTAYQCLESDRKKRPTMAEILDNVEKALRLQVSHDQEKRQKDENEKGVASLYVQDPEDGDQCWEEKLPSCYREIIRRADSPVKYSTKKELYSRLCEGIVVDNGTKLFSLKELNDKVYVCQMVSASEIFVNAKWNPKHRSLIPTSELSSFFIDRELPLPESRFSKTAKFENSKKINQQCRIRSEMLSVRTTYAAYLLFRFKNNYYNEEYEWNYKALSRSYQGDSDQHVTKREDGWKEIEMWQFVNNGKNVVFEFDFKTLGSISDVIIEGIELRPLDYEHGVLIAQPTTNIQPAEEENNDVTGGTSETEWEHKLPSDYQDIIRRADNINFSTVKELYYLLCSGLFIDNGQKWFSLNPLNGKKCIMLSARDLVIEESEETPENMEWKSIQGSRFKQVASVKHVTEEFQIQGKLKTRMLSFDTKYAVYLIFQHDENRVHNQELVGAFIRFDGQEAQTRRVYLETQSDMLILKNDQVDGVSFPPKDSWIELCIWPEFDVTEGIDEIEVGIRSDFFLSYVIDGIEFRPKDNANL